LNWPLIATGEERLMVPLPKLTISLVAGTPTGVQLFGLNQSELAEPFQVLFVWARAEFAKRTNASPKRHRIQKQG
jgi:hypothetical protein